MVHKNVPLASTPKSERPPGWYPLQGTVNEQVRWDGESWTARRHWNGATWVELPLTGDEAAGAADWTSPRPDSAAPLPPSGAARRSRRPVAFAVTIIVLAAALALGLVLASTGSTHRSTSVTTSTAAPVGNSTATTTSRSTSPSTPTSTPASTPTSTPRTAPTSTSTTAAPGLAFIPSEAALEACNADGQSLETALNAYMAQTGSYPAPPSAWSAATYDSNFAPLTSSANGGPYLRGVPATTSFVIEYDAFGHVWVAPPGTYAAAYNAGQDFEKTPDICQAAIG